MTNPRNQLPKSWPIALLVVMVAPLPVLLIILGLMKVSFGSIVLVVIGLSGLGWLVTHRYNDAE